VPSQKISVEESLRAYTKDAAHAGFQEASLGTLESGKLADLVILDRDLFAIPAEEIRDVKIVATMVGGKVVFGAALPSQEASR
jgi:predicted amidohydrolase YtcJ